MGAILQRLYSRTLTIDHLWVVPICYVCKPIFYQNLSLIITGCSLYNQSFLFVSNNYINSTVLHFFHCHDIALKEYASGLKKGNFSQTEADEYV